MIGRISKESVVQNLKDAGFQNDTISRFLECRDDKVLKDQIMFLKCQRCELVEDLHIAQKKIERLDYLIYSLKKEEQYQD